MCGSTLIWGSTPGPLIKSMRCLPEYQNGITSWFLPHSTILVLCILVSYIVTRCLALLEVPDYQGFSKPSLLEPPETRCFQYWIIDILYRDPNNFLTFHKNYKCYDCGKHEKQYWSNKNFIRSLELRIISMILLATGSRNMGW